VPGAGGAALRPGLRLRQAVNLANGSTLAGLGVAALGRAAIARSADGLLTGTGYRLPVPPAPAFCLGNVIVTRAGELDSGSRLFRHEARHATQFAWCGGVVMVPLYLTAAGVSWVLTGDFGARNVFERLAGLADGGYADTPLRPTIRRAAEQLAVGRLTVGRLTVGRLTVGRRAGPLAWFSGPGRPAGARVRRGPWPASAARDGSTASPSRSAGTPGRRAARRSRS
jgi:hypothetical protein